MTEPLTAEQVAEFREMVAGGRMGFVDERARLLATIDAKDAQIAELEMDRGELWRLDRGWNNLLTTAIARIASLERAMAAISRLVDSDGNADGIAISDIALSALPTPTESGRAASTSGLRTPTDRREGTDSGGVCPYYVFNGCAHPQLCEDGCAMMEAGTDSGGINSDGKEQRPPGPPDPPDWRLANSKIG